MDVLSLLIDKKRNISLNDTDRQVRSFILARIGSTRVPASVPVLWIAKCLKVSRTTIFRSIKRLVAYGYLETWVVCYISQGRIVKKRYFRGVFGSRKVSLRSDTEV